MGNQAAIVESDSLISDQLMQEIATEINFPATSFICKYEQEWKIRWFSTKTEIQLCGHGTLAAAAYIFNKFKISSNNISFTTISGKIICYKKTDHFYEIETAAKKSHKLTQEIQKEDLGSNIKILSIQKTMNEFTLVEVESEAQVKIFIPNFDYLLKNKISLLITAPGETCDFVCRCFAPNYGEPEDAATGSAQAILAPFWSQKLKKNEFISHQISKNGGLFYARISDPIVTIGGYCHLAG